MKGNIMDFDVTNKENVKKLVNIDNYLKEYSRKDLQEGEVLKRETIDENEFVEIDDDALEDVNVKKIVKSIYKQMNLDNRGGVTEEEFAEFKDLIEAAGLSEEEMEEAFSYVNKEVKKDDDSTSFSSMLKALKDELGLSGATAAGYTGGTSGGTGLSSIGGYGTANIVTPQFSSDVTMQELEDELAERESALTEAQNAQSEAANNLKIKEDEMDAAKAEYDELLAAEAENNPAVAELKEDKEENEEKLETCQKSIDDTKESISEKETAIKEKEGQIKSLRTELTGLKEQLETLKKSDSTEDNASAISECESQIEAKEAEIEQAEEEYEKLNDEKTELETTLKELENDKADIEAERSTIETNIANAVSQTTRDALTAYQNARSAYEDAEKTADEADDNVEAAQKALDDVNDRIEEQKEIQTKYEKEASEWLNELKETNGDAWNGFDKLCSALGKTEEETMAYLTELCTSSEYGNGCISPVVLCGQICQESGYNSSAVGDGGKAVGLGQFHTIAVEEVNRVYGTNYTSSDRYDPVKSLEMMTLLLKYDYSQTGSTEGMLAMYNRGNANGINTSAGQAYVSAIEKRINQAV